MMQTQPAAKTSAERAVRGSRGFSLVELISVFLIIAVLIALSIGVGRSVLQSRGERATQNVLQVLDQTLSTYIAVKNAKPPEFYTDRAGKKFPLVDARTTAGSLGPSGADGGLVPSLALAILVMQDVPECKVLLNQIPPEFIRRGKLTVAGNDVQVTGDATAPGTGDNSVIFVVDAWGQPIRFVHPAFHGRFPVEGGSPEAIDVAGTPTNFTRLSTVGEEYKDDLFDSDEGYCPNNRPYFYSGGLDQKAGTRKDNLYSTIPTFAAEQTQQQRPN